MHAARAALLSGLVLLPALASAQDRPPATPTRDVGVTYRVTGVADQGSGPVDMRMSWLNAEQKLRMDLPGGIGWSLLDQRTQRIVMVLEQLRMVAEVPVQDGLTAMLPNARFTRGANATVAGHPCTVWRYEGGGGKGEACVTTDGVMLRAHGTRGARGGTVEARRVVYGPQDPARFRVPQDYQTMPAGFLDAARKLLR